jgi:hypothetical protein
MQAAATRCLRCCRRSRKTHSFVPRGSARKLTASTSNARPSLQGSRASASEAAERAVIADLIGDNPSVTANAILDNAALTPDAKQRLLSAVAHTGEPEPSPRISQATALALLARVRSPNGGADGGGGIDVGDSDNDANGGRDADATGRAEHDDNSNGGNTSIAPLVEAYSTGKLNKADLALVMKQFADAQTPARGAPRGAKAGSLQQPKTADRCRKPCWSASR